MKLIFIVILLVLSGTALSRAPIKLDTVHPSIKTFSLNEVCENKGFKHILLALPKGTGAVDCMGSSVSITKFCKKKFPDNHELLRGFINFEKRATCHFAQSLILSLDCNRFPQYCKSPKRGCNALKGIYAVSQVLTHSGRSSHDEGDLLKCYFANTLPDFE
ncbi:MAG: hypothetical protein KAG61_10410 [Bacteriovoracaceae bacterium]|nr:hypothetical protein [Bacteriovoracaceae bacterium]